jgi:hypothetical protein
MKSVAVVLGLVVVVGGFVRAEEPLVVQPAELEYLPAVMIGEAGQKEAQANFDALAAKYNGKTVRYTGAISEQGRPQKKGKDEIVAFTIKNKSGKNGPQSSAIEFVVDGDYKPLALAVKEKQDLKKPMPLTVTVEGVFTASSTKTGSRTIRITGKVVEMK